MSRQGKDQSPAAGGAYAVIAGFGVPGRAVAECLQAHGVPYSVIDANPRTVERCARGGMSMICGDARDPEILRRAGLPQATLLVVAIPEETVSLETVSAARRLNPQVAILARCVFISGGLQAMVRGANEVVVAEQAIAKEFSRLIEARLSGGNPAPQEPNQPHPTPCRSDSQDN